MLPLAKVFSIVICCEGLWPRSTGYTIKPRCVAGSTIYMSASSLYEVHIMMKSDDLFLRMYHY